MEMGVRGIMDADADADTDTNHDAEQRSMYELDA